MKVTYQLEPDDLKAALIAWMATRGTPISLSDEFDVTASGVVTIVASNAPTIETDAVAAPITPIAAPVVSPIATSPIVVSPIAPISTTSPGHMVAVDPPLSVTGQATEFGFNDPTDNGLGFFYDPATGKPYATNNDVLRGVSLPREVLLSTFLKIDSWKTEGITDVWSRNGSMLRQWVDGNEPLVTIDSGGKSCANLPIVDAGPTAGTGNAIDLTGAVTKELGTNGKALATFMIVVAGAPIPIRGWSWETGKVG